MTRTAIRSTLAALAAVALVSAFAGTAVSANELSGTERELVDSLQSMFQGTTRGLTAQKPQQKATIRWMREYSVGIDLRK